ncbi:MAG: DJ-1/PfpI family protein [Candidatus Hydrogenedentes bacterium]|nr:DJ-1/PfpI family protein [Candidatus Hydrogenedentota bacterium]MBI3117114.1 DJ-1/PfpI family protein [Candidatus Hydrogenedentota bacterium]
MGKVLLVVGDGGEVIDTMVPYYRLSEDHEVVVAAPERRTYHLVQHEHDPNWDITVEMPGYTIKSDIAFRDVQPDEYIALVLPGGRAPEFLRYDQDLLRITRDFFAKEKPVATICHGVEILAAAGVLQGVEVTTIPRCRFDVEVVGAIYVDQPLVIHKHLYSCRFKRECAAWMKAFSGRLANSATATG